MSALLRVRWYCQCQDCGWVSGSFQFRSDILIDLCLSCGSDRLIDIQGLNDASTFH